MDSHLQRDSQLLASKIILIDGFSSSGKSLVCPLITALNKVENWQIDYSYEQIAILYYQDKISINSVRAIYNTRTDELIYNLFLSRNINFRKTDMTSPFFIENEDKYLKRLDKKEGNDVVKEIQQIEPIIPLHIHYIFGYTDILLKAFRNKLSLYIIMLRDPLYLVCTWDKDNWVNRIGTDNRDYHLTLNYKNKIIPWFAKEYANEYIKANDTEKSILTIYNLYKRIFSMYECLNFDEKQKIMIIFFDEFINHPMDYVDKICQSLNTTKSQDFDKMMSMLSLPRSKQESVMTIEKFMIEKSKKISPYYKKISIELYEMYNEFYLSHRLRN